MATTTSAVAVIERALARPSPTPRAVLTALTRAGFEVRARRATWMPTTPEAQAFVDQAGLLHEQGKHPQDIAAELGKAKRMVYRYLAAYAEQQRRRAAS